MPGLIHEVDWLIDYLLNDWLIDWSDEEEEDEEIEPKLKYERLSADLKSILQKVFCLVFRCFCQT